MTLLDDIEARVHGYFTGTAVPIDELPKHRLVRETCELARKHGITEFELHRWARSKGEPSVAVMSAVALHELQARLRKRGGALRFRVRLARDEGGRR